MSNQSKLLKSAGTDWVWRFCLFVDKFDSATDYLAASPGEGIDEGQGKQSTALVVGQTYKCSERNYFFKVIKWKLEVVLKPAM